MNDKYSFPIGKIRPVNDILTNLNLNKAILNTTLRRNTAYTYQFLDVVDWFLNDTDIGLTAKEQIIKYGIVAINCIMEAAVVDYLERHPRIKVAKSLKKNIHKLGLKKSNPVPQPLRTKLDFVHEKRKNVHLPLCGDRLEHHQYKIENYTECKAIVSEFIDWIVKRV